MDTGKKYLRSDVDRGVEYGNPERFPWIEIGNLYVTLIEAGGASNWDTVVGYAWKTKKKKNFVILTGRHGSAYGSIYALGTGRLTDNQKDPSHTTLDKEQADAIMSGNRNLKIEVEDCSDCNSRALQDLTMRHLREGNVVIYAWCYSLYTFIEHVADSGGKLRPVTSNYIVDCHSLPISEIVKLKFRWALAA